MKLLHTGSGAITLITIMLGGGGAFSEANKQA